MKATMNNRTLANQIATSVGYGGGYLYPGDYWTFVVPWEEPGRYLRPQLRTRVHFVKSYDKSPDQPRTAWNKRILASLPVGSLAKYTHSLNDYSEWATFEKTGPCRWRKVSAGGERAHQMWWEWYPDTGYKEEWDYDGSL